MHPSGPPSRLTAPPPPPGFPPPPARPASTVSHAQLTHMRGSAAPAPRPAAFAQRPNSTQPTLRRSQHNALPASAVPVPPPATHTSIPAHPGRSAPRPPPQLQLPPHHPATPAPPATAASTTPTWPLGHAVMPVASLPARIGPFRAYLLTPRHAPLSQIPSSHPSSTPPPG